jgi:hypothetical protein
MPSLKPLQRSACIPKEYQCWRCHGTLRVEVIIVSCYNCGAFYALDCDDRTLIRLQLKIDGSISGSWKYH